VKKPLAIVVPFGWLFGCFQKEGLLRPESRTTIPVLGASTSGSCDGLLIDHPGPPRGRHRACSDVFVIDLVRCEQARRRLVNTSGERRAEINEGGGLKEREVPVVNGSAVADERTWPRSAATLAAGEEKRARRPQEGSGLADVLASPQNGSIRKVVRIRFLWKKRQARHRATLEAAHRL